MKINYKKYKKISGFIVSLIILTLPVFFLSAGEIGCGDSTINNPLGCNNDSVEKILLKFMDLVAVVGAIVVVFFIIYSGFIFVTAGGDTGKVTKARDMFFATVIGGAILLGADIIANVVVNTVNTTVGRNP